MSRYLILCVCLLGCMLPNPLHVTKSVATTVHTACPVAARSISSSTVRCNAMASAEAAAAVAPGSLVDRMRGALWGVLIADALSMPVHW